MPESTSRLIAALADRYRIERELGAGGMATVYLAEDLKHHRRVAVKVLRPELAAALGHERFLREIEISAGLSHPHILPLHDSGEAGGFLYYVMPYVEGESLRGRLDREKQLPLDEALALTRQVAGALEYAHAHGVIHRDIKPENILLQSGHAVVADFGIARAISAAGGDKLTQTGMAVGTPTYMSPEQAGGGGDLDTRSDLYALGCVLYEMLAGEPPFTGPTVESVIRQHLVSDAPPVTERRGRVPPGVAAALDRALAKSPADRFGTAEEFSRALEARQAAPPAGPRRGRVSVWWVAAPAAVAAVALTLVLRGGGSDGRSSLPPTSLRQITFSAEVEEYPALAPDGARLAFSRDVDGLRQIFLTDLVSGEERQLTTSGYDNIQAAWTPDGAALLFVRAGRPGTRLEPSDLFAVFGEGDVWRLDLATGEQRRLIADAYNPAVAADGRVAFDASRGGTRRIWVADERGRNARQVSFDSSEAVTHVDPSWAPDEQRIAFQLIERTKFDIGLADLSSGETRRLTDDVFLDVNPVWDAEGQAVFVSSYRSGGLNIWRIPMTPRGEPAGPPEQVTTGAGQDVQIATAGGTGTLAFTVLRLNADLWRLPVDPASGRPTGEPEPLVVTTREDSRGAWSPDGREVAFNSDRAGDMNIWVYALADGTTRQVTHGPGGDYQPHWSPDGRRLAFFSARSGNADVWLVDVASGELTQLTTSPWLDINPSFSPDGRRVAFQSDREGRMEVWVMSADGTDQHQLTDVGASGHFLPWSRDGAAVYTRAVGSGEFAPVRVNVADGQVTPVPVKGGAHMSFSPDGSRVADVDGHQRIFGGGEPYQVFAFEQTELRIDYPVWSPDGRWILFDRWEPEGGDVWLLEWQ